MKGKTLLVCCAWRAGLAAAAAVLWLVAASLAMGAEHASLVSNDPSFDNGPVMSRLIAEADGPIRVPGGVYFHATTIDDDGTRGWAIEGGGIDDWSTWSGARRAKSAAVFVYVGPPDQPAWRLWGSGWRLEGVNVWRGFRGAPEWQTTRGSVGLEITRGAGRGDPPTAKCLIPQISTGGFDRAIAVTGPTNGDTLDIGFWHSSHDRTSFYCDNPQTTGIHIDMLHLAGPGEEVFDFRRGGNLWCGTLLLNPQRLIFRLGATDSNTCTFAVANLKVDNNAGRNEDGTGGWRLVEMERLGPLNLSVAGHIGRSATPGERPVVLRRPANTTKYAPDYTRLRLDLWPSGKAALLAEEVGK